MAESVIPSVWRAKNLHLSKTPANLSRKPLATYICHKNTIGMSVLVPTPCLHTMPLFHLTKCIHFTKRKILFTHEISNFKIFPDPSQEASSMHNALTMGPSTAPVDLHVRIKKVNSYSSFSSSVAGLFTFNLICTQFTEPVNTTIVLLKTALPFCRNGTSFQRLRRCQKTRKRLTFPPFYDSKTGTFL